MTPIGHCGTGVAATGIFSMVLNRVFRIPYRALIVISFISSLLPDIDGLSLLVSHRAYYGKNWYSHHMLGHSFLSAAAAGLLTALSYITVATAVRGAMNLFRNDKIMPEFRLRKFAGAFIVSFTAYGAHLAGDLITPPGPWGGLALLWPSKVMYGGSGKIFWHNWYIIYTTLLFMGIYIFLHVAAGLIPPVKKNITGRINVILRGAAVILSLLFLADVSFFIYKNDYRSVGVKGWEEINREGIHEEFLRIGDAYYGKALGLWKKTALTKYDLLNAWNRVLAQFVQFHSRIFVYSNSGIPGISSSDDDLKIYRQFQNLAPGMEDDKPGKYRMWIIMDNGQKQKFYDRGFVWLYVHRLKKSVLQATNARMEIFQVNRTDGSGNALSVSRVYSSDKIFVPDRKYGLLNTEAIKMTTYRMWDYAGIPYNLIPRSAFSRNRNLLNGFYPSLNTIPGYIRPGRRTGIMIHSGVWSEGCIISSYGHLNISSLLQSPFYRVWDLADSIVDTGKIGTVYRGKEKIWGRMMMIRNFMKLPEDYKKTPVEYM